MKAAERQAGKEDAQTVQQLREGAVAAKAYFDQRRSLFEDKRRLATYVLLRKKERRFTPEELAERLSNGGINSSTIDVLKTLGKGEAEGYVKPDGRKYRGTQKLRELLRTSGVTEAVFAPIRISEANRIF